MEAWAFRTKFALVCIKGRARVGVADVKSSRRANWGAILIRFDYIDVAIHPLTVGTWPLLV